MLLRHFTVEEEGGGWRLGGGGGDGGGGVGGADGWLTWADSTTDFLYLGFPSQMAGEALSTSADGLILWNNI